MRLAAVAVMLTAAGCSKRPTQVAAPPAPAANAPHTGGNTNYESGAGAAQNVRNAAMRTVRLADLHTLAQLIEVEYAPTGKMPDIETMKKSLRQDAAAAPVAAAVDAGSLILCWKDHAGLWAYEIDADTKGGLVLVAGVPNRADAAEVQALLAKK